MQQGRADYCLDYSALERLRQDIGTDFVRELFAVFVSDAAVALGKLKHDVNSGTAAMQQIHDTAHAIEGICANIYAIRMLRTARDIGIIEHDKPPRVEQLLPLLDRLEHEFYQTQSAMQEYLSALGND